MSWELGLLGALTKTVSFVLLGARYRLPLWEFSILIGIGTFILETILNRRVPHLAFWSWRSSAANIVIVAPIIEELIFRLALITFLFTMTGSIIIAVFVSAILFGMLHLGYGAYRFLNTFLSGLLLGIIFVNFGIVPVILIHMTHNFIATITGG